MQSGSIIIGYSPVPQEFVVPLPWTPDRVDISVTPQGEQVCGGTMPETWEPRIVPCGFHLIVMASSNTCQIDWTAYQDGEDEVLDEPEPQPKPVEIQVSVKVNGDDWTVFAQQYRSLKG